MSEPAPTIWVPLAIAAMCADCNAVFTLSQKCPACASQSVVSLDAFLNREQRWTAPA